MYTFLPYRLKLLDDIDLESFKLALDTRYFIPPLTINRYDEFGHICSCTVRFIPKVCDSFGSSIYLAKVPNAHKVFIVNSNKEYIGTLRPCTQSAIKIFVEVFCNDAPSDRCAKSTLSALFA